MSAVFDEALSFRPMVEIDLAQVLDIERSSYEFPWSEGIFTDCLRVGYCSWIVQLGARLSGYGIIAVGAADAHILNLCIHAEYRRIGLGRALLSHMLDLASQHSASEALLEVRPSNFGAIKLYVESGFKEVGLRRDYYPARIGREDALVLSKKLERHGHAAS